MPSLERNCVILHYLLQRFLFFLICKLLCLLWTAIGVVPLFHLQRFLVYIICKLTWIPGRDCRVVSCCHFHRFLFLFSVYCHELLGKTFQVFPIAFSKPLLIIYCGVDFSFLPHYVFFACYERRNVFISFSRSFLKATCIPNLEVVTVIPSI